MNREQSFVDVEVDALMAQGHGNLAVRLVAADEAQPLPAFEAGAHVDLHLPGGLIRQYSIASAPQQRDHYLLCIRREAQSRGGSAYIHDRLRVGERLRIGLPRNLFSLSRDASHSVLIAGGIGITPLLSMAYALDAQRQSFELHYYVRERKEAAFARQWNKGFLHGGVFVHCSTEGASARTSLPQCLGAPDAAAQIYVCGPQGFMEHVSIQAQDSGWAASQIHQEAFGVTAPATLPDGGNIDEPFEVELASNGQVFIIPIGQSIASVLQGAGVEVPLSCEMGVCGACLTSVREGVPDHRDTVLSEAEKMAENPLIALCCSRSRSPRLVLAL